MTQDRIGRDSPSVADVEAFEALPLETQEIARRVLLYENYPEEIVDLWLFDDVQAVRRGETLPWEQLHGAEGDVPKETS